MIKFRCDEMQFKSTGGMPPFVPASKIVAVGFTAVTGTGRPGLDGGGIMVCLHETEHTLFGMGEELTLPQIEARLESAIERGKLRQAVVEAEQREAVKADAVADGEPVVAGVN